MLREHRGENTQQVGRCQKEAVASTRLLSIVEQIQIARLNTKRKDDVDREKSMSDACIGKQHGNFCRSNVPIPEQT